MHTPHKARETPKAHRIAGDEVDPVAGEPQGGDGLARRQAGAFAEKNFRSLRSHSDVTSAGNLSRPRHENKASGRSAAFAAHKTRNSVGYVSAKLLGCNLPGIRPDPRRIYTLGPLS